MTEQVKAKVSGNDARRQTISSAATSVRTISAAYTNKNTAMYLRDRVVLDYGCGRYNDAERYAREKLHVREWYGFDPYNRTAEQNDACWTGLQEYGNAAETTILSNVLNVIQDLDDRMNTILDAMSHTIRTLIVKIYEGNKTGVGRQTRSDSWQENRAAATYIPELTYAAQIAGRKMSYEKYGAIIICHLEPLHMIQLVVKRGNRQAEARFTSTDTNDGIAFSSYLKERDMVLKYGKRGDGAAYIVDGREVQKTVKKYEGFYYTVMGRDGEQHNSREYGNYEEMHAACKAEVENIKARMTGRGTVTVIEYSGQPFLKEYRGLEQPIKGYDIEVGNVSEW